MFTTLKYSPVFFALVIFCSLFVCCESILLNQVNVKRKYLYLLVKYGIHNISIFPILCFRWVRLIPRFKITRGNHRFTLGEPFIVVTSKRYLKTAASDMPVKKTGYLSILFLQCFLFTLCDAQLLYGFSQNWSQIISYIFFFLITKSLVIDHNWIVNLLHSIKFQPYLVFSLDFPFLILRSQNPDSTHNPRPKVTSKEQNGFSIKQKTL